MVIAAAALALATLAGAGTAPVAVSHELRWTRGPGAEACIGELELAQVVSARLGRAVFVVGAAGSVVIDGRVEPVGAGWQVTLVIRGPDGAVRGTRQLELTGADCRALDEPLALVLALILDPEGSEVPARARPPAPPTAPTRPRTGEVAITGAGGVGLMPGTSVGARLVAVVDPPRWWPIAIDASWWGAAVDELGDGRGVLWRSWQVGAGVCTPGQRLGRAELAACAGGELARLEAQGLGFARSRTDRATVVMATLEGRATVELADPVFAMVELGAAASLVRPRLVDEAGMVVHQVPAASLFGAVGVGVRF